MAQLLGPSRLPNPAPRPSAPCRIEQAVQLLRQGAPRAKILVMGILPRGTGTGKGLLNAQNDFSWPSHYTKAVAGINKQLRHEPCWCYWDQPAFFAWVPVLCPGGSPLVGSLARAACVHT